jgi:D-alanyl-D-alanine carboxypeptidase (penicillin-binding protein 5/6)
MTAIIALEKGKPEDRVVVRNIPLPPEASMGLRWGDVLTLEDLLWGLLLPSGNDAATVIADYIGGGSVENFVRMMNEKAAALGLKDTHFVNPHGLDEEDHYSSAYDLAVIGRYAMSKPLFARIVGTESHVVRASRTFYLRNSNFLLRPQNRSIGADGIKTGYTDEAGDSIVASATRDGHRVIVVALGARDRTAEAIKLFNYAFANFRWVDLSPPPYLVASDGEGHARPLGAKSPFHQLVPRWLAPQLVPVIKLKQGAGLVPGAPVGSAIYYDGGAVLAEVPLYVR